MTNIIQIFRAATSERSRRLGSAALDALLLIAAILALYLCAVIPSSALDITIVYKRF